jgi:hypothetical protein
MSNTRLQHSVCSLLDSPHELRQTSTIRYQANFYASAGAFVGSWHSYPLHPIVRLGFRFVLLLRPMVRRMHSGKK